ncbi:thiamine/thiamine pyrophosphate ABC transporter permease [Rhizobium sp. TRM95111]|uniref:thiamine/thiamine pyrophosphate ABC transporter permease n=1 Tax=Rhizobium alarense TaxID=2846851 RepID=UPI001F43A0CC|nr:thiamine/thiamine pyrophosphate ABC transporter permease [Rhizobium alarense]MCF3641196.1 thiamine/thiamine pyrophosphate ABC transporter permease [Rhizobium alarense]
MYARAERRFLLAAGGTALGFVVLFVGIAVALLLAHGGGPRGGLFDAYVARVVRFTLLQAALSTLLSVALAIPVARALARQRRFPGRRWLIGLSALPLGLPALVATLGVIEIWGRQGVVNDIAGALGIAARLNVYGLTGILIAHVFFNLPLAARLMLAGLERIPGEYRLTAANLGMGPSAVFRLIEWPVLRRLVPGIAGLVFMLCATSFTIVLTLGGGPAATTIEVAIYQALRFDFDPGRAVLLAFLQIALTAALLMALSVFAAPVDEGTTGGRPVRRFDAAAGRIADALVLALFTLFVAAPLAAVAVAGLAADAGRLAADPLVHRALATSLAIAVASAACALALALPVVCVPLVERRAASPLRGALDAGLAAAGSLVLLVPPVVIATGWFLALRPLGDTGAYAPVVVTLINALMALPFAVRVLGPAVRTHVARTGRLAASLGVTGMHRLRWIDLPALKRPLLTAFTFAMALSLGDLGAVAIFGADGFVTLPWLLFSRMGSYRTDDAAGIALLLGMLCLLLALPATARGEGRSVHV